ncbi:hypothetical protein EDB89DRAFT_2248353 [Lactarius sanguifluus]|nr:hypothetical protein EDB89DRAFT_2248353 [Lactarius sanguifluus]
MSSVELLVDGSGWRGGVWGEVSVGVGSGFLVNFPKRSLGGRLDCLGIWLVTRGDREGKKETGERGVNPLNSASLGQPDVRARKRAKRGERERILTIGLSTEATSSSERGRTSSKARFTRYDDAEGN